MNVKDLLTLQKHQKLRKRKEKYKKRQGHKSRSRSDSSSRSSSSGDELLEKFIKIVRRSDLKEEACVSESTAPSNANPAGQNSNTMHVSTTQQLSYSRVNRNESRSKPESRARPSKEELDAKRAQMARDAEDHAKHRLDRYNKHNYRKEEEEARQSSEARRHGASFLSHLKNDHVQRASIEEGIHRKASSRQREMNSNFLRK